MAGHTVGALSPQEAFQLLKNEPAAVLVDIRSTMEYLFVGHPAGAVHVPWIDEPSWDVDPNFVDALRRSLPNRNSGGLPPEERPIVLICRSGNRSDAAGILLMERGFKRVFHVADGFEGDLDADHHRNTLNGWRFEGLPWEQC